MAMAAVQIFVKTFDGKTSTLDVEGTDTIEQVQAKIREQFKIPVEQQRLKLGSKRTFGGETIKMDVETSDTIDNVIARMDEELQIEPTHQLLIFEHDTESLIASMAASASAAPP